MIDMPNVGPQMLGTAFSLVFTVWPLLLLSVFERRRDLLPAALVGWIMLALIRVAMLFLPSLLTLSIFIHEPWNTVLFIVTGAVLFAVWYVRRRGRATSFSRRPGEARSVEDLLALSPSVFEEMVAELYRLKGHRARRTGAVGDHGVDVVVETGNGETWVVQCKRWSGAVGEREVRDLYGAMHHEKADGAALITSGTFTLQARTWAQGKPIWLYDGREFLSHWRKAKREADGSS
jgi:HJR/Mrr/RecB family endonuclease